MKKTLLLFIFAIASFILLQGKAFARKPVRILVVTGGHSYDKPSFNEMLNGLGKDISSQVVEFPAAFDQFLPENRGKYDVLVFYHMWQKITPAQEKIVETCIREGKPLVVLHHSICAFDEWPEYLHIIGGKYFHQPTLLDGKQYPACTYIHDLHFRVRVAKPWHPVTRGVKDFDIFDETYKGFYVEPDVETLLTTEEESSTPVIAWTKKYGKARVVTLQSGHDTPTFRHPSFRKLLRQAILWCNNGNLENRKTR